MQRFVRALQGAEPIKQIHDHRYPGDVDPQRFAEPADRAQSWHRGSIEKPPGPFPPAGLSQPELDEVLDQRGMESGLRSQSLERQVLRLLPTEHDFVSLGRHHQPSVINSRGLKRDSAPRLFKSSFSFGPGLGGMTILSFTY